VADELTLNEMIVFCWVNQSLICDDSLWLCCVALVSDVTCQCFTDLNTRLFVTCETVSDVTSTQCASTVCVCVHS